MKTDNYLLILLTENEWQLQGFGFIGCISYEILQAKVTNTVCCIQILAVQTLAVQKCGKTRCQVVHMIDVSCKNVQLGMQLGRLIQLFCDTSNCHEIRAHCLHSLLALQQALEEWVAPWWVTSYVIAQNIWLWCCNHFSLQECIRSYTQITQGLKNT